MKKIILAGIMALALFPIAADAQVSFALRGGVNVQNLNGKDALGDKTTNDVVIRYNIGALVNLPVAPDFFVQTGAVFETRGAKVTTVVSGNERVRNVHLNYIEVPFNLLYSPVVGSGRVLFGFGPYVAYGISGKIVTAGEPDEKVIWQNKVATSDVGQAYFKPLEMGANFLFGYEFFNHLQVQLNAQLGLTKVNPTDARISGDKTATKNTGFGISLGWKF